MKTWLNKTTMKSFQTKISFRILKMTQYKVISNPSLSISS